MLLLIWLSPVVLREFAVSHYSLTARVVLVSLQVSMVVEGMIVVRGNRGVLPLSTSRRVLFHPPSPQRTLSIGSVIGKARG